MKRCATCSNKLMGGRFDRKFCNKDCWRVYIRADSKQTGRYSHGGYTTNKPEHNSWRAMRERCYNPNYWAYKHYGGRGIAVDERWLGKNGFVKFLSDMGKKPTPKHSLDRIDTQKGYSAENCRWSTQKTQVRNSSKVVLVTIGNITKPLTQWCEQYGIKSATVHTRHRKLNWGYQKAITTPVNPASQKFRALTQRG